MVWDCALHTPMDLTIPLLTTSSTTVNCQDNCTGSERSDMSYLHAAHVSWIGTLAGGHMVSLDSSVHQVCQSQQAAERQW